jgi:hypothetical protein
MRSYVTSYSSLFGRRAADTPAVDRIEIPLIQRDYAQGRQGDAVERIRASFLDVLHDAIAGGERVSLDFVYGDVENGTLRPLDGQQRLTTLFLLHWYLACRAGRMEEEQGWKKLTYATRPSARLFCERLTACESPSSVEDPSSWIEDQPWYLHTWRHDPTIQSMLVMLDAIHQRFRSDDCVAAWQRLVSVETPAITFHLLPIERMGLSEDLYIKMNSRGKPLTPFENFKARFEKMLEASSPDRVDEFAVKVDGAWSDLLWAYRGGDDVVDDEFLRYFQFVTEACEWREGRLPSGDIASLAERVYGPSNPKAAAHLEFLFQAFDTWVDEDIAAVFAGLFTTTAAPIESDDTSKTVLFGQQGSLELFSACCSRYGMTRGRNRLFSWQHTLFLYVVILHRTRQTTDFSRRLRVIRNLVEASNNELRLERMPALLADLERIVVERSLEDVSALNQSQVADERLKTQLLATSPELERPLHHLEDHSVLRGCLAAFELDASVFARRAGAFHRLFADLGYLRPLTGALLAVGDYSRQPGNRAFQFGSGSNLAPWRELLTGAGRSHLGETRKVLGRLLDRVAQANGDPREVLEAIQTEWLEATDASAGLGWRWYFVKYAAMREGSSGIYVGSNGMLGYDVCMLDKTQMNSWYRDPYLLAIHRASGVRAAVEDPWFTGYETNPRWMRLIKSGTELRCVNRGFTLQGPRDAAHAEAFARVCEEHGVGDNYVLSVPQVEANRRLLDTSDRVQLGAALLRDLVAAGL